jgi:hypothetical protein
MDPHTAVGIATTVFHGNAVPICLYVTIRNWRKGERLTWYALSFFSMSKLPYLDRPRHRAEGEDSDQRITVRLASGVLVIVRASRPTDVGLIIGTLVLLNIGIIPLINMNQGFIRMT